MPVEGGESEPGFAAALRRVLLTRRGKPISRNYCAFWKTDNSGYYVEDFADILKSKFPSDSEISCLKGQTLIQNKPSISEGYFSASLEKALFSAVFLDYLYFLVSSCRFGFLGNGRDFCHGDFVAWADAHPLSG